MRAGKALRQKWADEAYAAKRCPNCGHGNGWHAAVVTEPPSGEFVNGQFVIQEAVWGAIACHADGCGCRRPNRVQP